jgi:ribonuclease J
MNINLKKHQDDLLFLPLGGAGEIGMNLNLYYYKGKWLMLDCGAGFAEDFLPGVNMIVADVKFIHERKKDLVGLVLPHAHEDHVGAIAHLWHEFPDVPIYATPFTASFLRAKLKDHPASPKAIIHEVAPGSSFNVDPFKLEMVQITHSVPEMNAVMIRTEHGNVFHTGDWKLDPKPMLGPKSDEAKLKKYGKEGVLAMVGDSTNIFSEGHSGSEGDLRQSLKKIIKEQQNLVLVTTFASNVARLESIAVAAEAAGRKVILAGRSLWRILDAAKESGYLKDAPEFLDEKQFDKYPREKLLVISTGCQGEPMAATHKIAHGTHRSITIKPTDTVIFCSKIIPGNDKRIFRLFNHFAKLGVETITERDHFVHVSGHPNRDEVKQMYSWVKPAISVPVHGELVHMHEHARMAKKWGAKHAFEMSNGTVLKLAPGEPEIVGMVHSGVMAIDGHYLIPQESPIIRMRLRMQEDGIIFVCLLLGKGKLSRPPLIQCPGVLDSKEDSDIFDSIRNEVSDAVNDHLNQSGNKSTDDRIYTITRTAIRRILKAEVGKRPSIEVEVIRL